jgi:hypothetical protein
MGKHEQKLAEYRAVRDSAQALFQGDVELLRESLTPHALADRASDQVAGLSDTALEAAYEHRGTILGGVVATIAAGAALWLAREPIRDAIDSIKDSLDLTRFGGTDQIEKDDTP